MNLHIFYTMNLYTYVFFAYHRRCLWW